MTLDDVVVAIDRPYWLDYLDRVGKAGAGWTPTPSESKHILELFAGELDARHVGRATNWAVLGLCLDTSRFVSAVRKGGYLRPTKRGYSDRTLLQLCKALASAEIPLPRDVRKYLRSTHLLQEIGAEVKKIHDGLMAHLRSLNRTGLKGTLATADLIFLIYQTRGLDYDRSLGSDHPQFFLPEELVEGFSFIFYRHTDEFGWPVRNSFLDPKAVKNGEYLFMLQVAALIRQFHEMEVLVDSLDYSIEKVGGREYILRPPSPELERAVRFGFIQTRFQEEVNFYRNADENHLRLKDAVEQLAEAMRSKFCKFVKEPVERFTTEFFVEGPVMKLLNDEGLFQEEYIFLQRACRELMTPLDDLLEFEVTAGLTVRDVLKTQRLINYVRWHMATYILPELSHRPGAVVQSLVPHFTDATFAALLGEALGNEKVQALIDLLVWKPEGSRVFDVQYQPIIREAKGYLVPLNLFGGSDLLRNLLQLTRRRLYEDGKNDPLPPMLKRVFLARTPYVEVSVSYGRAAEGGEIDVLVLWDGVLFAIECKNSLLPVGHFELRTSYDYIRIASDQLDRFQSAFVDESYRKDFATRLSNRTERAWGIDRNTKLVTCIVMANRMFMGYRLGQNAVRGSFELAAFVENGTHVMGDEGRCFWAGSTPCGEDLRAFIEDDTVYKLIWGAMEEYQEEYTFGACSVSWPAFRLWPRRLAELLGFTKVAAEIEAMEKRAYEERLKGQAELELLAAERRLSRRD